MGTIIKYLITGRCGWYCGHAHPYGFVPECGCPIHDPETLIHVIASQFVFWLRGDKR